MEQSLPKDIKIVTFDNTNDFLFASIREVVVTLIIAILLVLVVVFFFLQDFRATLIPAIGIVVSLIGTFAFMKVAGFSVNLLTLFALVLVIGTVRGTCRAGRAPWRERGAVVLIAVVVLGRSVVVLLKLPRK